MRICPRGGLEAYSLISSLVEVWSDKLKRKVGIVIDLNHRGSD